MSGVLHELRGLPASGKSSLALKLAQNHEPSVVLNRDSLRASLYPQGFKWSVNSEGIVKSLQQHAATEAVRRGYHAIIDDTNLLAKHVWPRFAVDNDVEYICHDLSDVPVETCISRDFARNRGIVGAGVINNMALRAGLIKWPDAPLMIVDIDGTIADLRHRLVYLERTPKNYTAFFEEVGEDYPFYAIINYVKILAARGYVICLVSGRPAHTGAATWQWLMDHCQFQQPFYGPFMRQSGDHRPDHIVKAEILARLPRNIACAFDDRDSIIENVWRPAGIPVIKVENDIIVYDEFAITESKQ